MRLQRRPCTHSMGLIIESSPTTLKGYLTVDVPSLSRLESVELRNAWKTEAGDFTPWLAQEDNIALLGNSIGLDLEVEAQEKEVGPLRADILCRDTVDQSWVLIENQLERTDHTHLGQLITYAAGLSAVKIVWIAARFTEEHRAAVDWLNEITDERFNFFALEVELWRIGNSPYAPKFNVVCKPNDWTRSVAHAAQRIQQEELTETRSVQLEYWTQLHRIMEERKGRVRPTKPSSSTWYSFAIGRSYCNLYAYANTQEYRIGVTILLAGKTGNTFFNQLRKQEAEISSAIGEAVLWDEKPGRAECTIRLEWSSCSLADRSAWKTQHEWLYARLELLDRVFRERIRNLDAEATVDENQS